MGFHLFKSRFPICSFLIILSIFYCSGKPEDQFKIEENTGQLPEQEGWNSELRISKAGLLQAVVLYGHMVKHENQNIIFFDEGIDVDFYDQEGQHNSHLKSDRGQYHEDTEDVFGMGNVVVVSDSGATLRTEVLRWDNRHGKIISDTSVMVTTENLDTLYGTGFESNADLSHRVIHKPRGISNKSLDFNQIEESFAKPVSEDTSDQKGLKREDEH